MKAAQHRLVGYDPRTELESFELPIPDGALRMVETFVQFDDDDPAGVGSYQLTNGQARRIADLVRNGQNWLPLELHFFLEAYR
jgi:hypothetical protein